MANSRRPKPPIPPSHRRTDESQQMAAVRGHAQAIRSELTATPAVGTDLRPGQLVRAEAMRILRQAELDEPSARQRMVIRAVRELFEQLLGTA